MDGATILVADHDAARRDRIGDYLEQQGYDVESSADARGGLKLFQEGVIELVVAVHDPPKLDGGRLAAAVKTMDPDMLVILIATAPLDAEALLATGADFYLASTEAHDQLHQMVVAALATPWRTRR